MCAHHMSESEELIDIKRGQRLVLKSRIRNQTGQNCFFAVLIGIKPWSSIIVTSGKQVVNNTAVKQDASLLQALMFRGPTFAHKPEGLIAGWVLAAVSRWPGSLFVFVNVGDRWQGHTAISVTFTCDVQYVLFPRDDRGEPAAVHPSSHIALCGLKKEQPKFN